MKYVELGNSGIDVSVVALGCWAFGGGDYWGKSGTDDEKDALATVDAALDAGINFFDTAESYNDGQSDLFLGRAMRGRRTKFVVSSKVYLDKLGEKDITRVCEQSLARMETDYIDLFSPHFASREIPFSETFGALQRLRERGLIRAIGISNFGVQSLDLLEEIDMIDQIDLHQLPYNLLWRAIEFGIQQKTVEADIGIICYSTLAQGLLSGLYENTAQVPDNFKVLRFFDSSRVGAGHGGQGCESDVFAAIAKLKSICDGAGLELAPACIAWLFYRNGVKNVLTGARTPAQLSENLKAMDLRLTPELVLEMAKATERVKQCIGSNADMWSSEADSRIF